MPLADDDPSPRSRQSPRVRRTYYRKSKSFFEYQIAIAGGIAVVAVAVLIPVLIQPEQSTPIPSPGSPSSVVVQTITKSWAPPLWVWVTVCAALAVTVVLLGWYIFSRVQRERADLSAIEKEAAFQRTLEEKKLAQLKTVTPLATLLELNQDQIDQYHRIATEQADRSFRSSQRAMAIGLAVIVACLAAGIYLRSSEAKIFVGAVAAVGAALSGFLNRTYIHMYGQTLGQLNRYFDQPVLTGYYLTAERLAQELPDNPEGEMRRMIIQQVLQSSAHLNGQRPEVSSKRQKRKSERTGRSKKVLVDTADLPAHGPAGVNGSSLERLS
jgi:hypothetical protein